MQACGGSSGDDDEPAPPPPPPSSASPTISDIADRSTPEDTATSAIPFTIADGDTPLGSLTLSATSSNTTLVPVSGVTFGGSGANRTVRVTPAANASGAATITITVSDGQQTASDAFVLTVTAVNDVPTISSIPNRTTGVGVATGPLAFTVGDVETAASSLTVTARSSNTTLVPTANIALGGSGRNRTVTVTPRAGSEGTARITLTVSDGTATASTSFTLTVSATTPPAPVGLDSRPSNLSCVAPARNTSGGTTIALERAFPNLSFDQPLAMLQAPGDDSRWFVLEKGGDVRVFANSPNVSTDSSFFSVSVNDSNEGGLLGMAFHPQWATNRHAFVSYTAGSSMVSYVDRYTSTNGGATLNASTRQEIIRVNQPETNHNGGQIAFGPDGLLYIGLGDGGPGGDPNNTAQDTTDLLGSMLRLNVNNVSSTSPYAIPSDNPFAGQAVCGPSHTVSANNCPEIFAWGFRNPWRWSFDRSTGDLWVADVGQSTREEINRVQLGGNYGWSCREGTGSYNTSRCPTSGLINPVHEYGRTLGQSVTGGYVYRGSVLPALVGRYLFADYGTGTIWPLMPNGSGGYDREELLDTTLSIASFAEGNNGELYVIDIAGGRIYAIVDGDGGPPPGPPVPTLLSDTGCVDEQDPTQPAPGLIPYEPVAPFWSDNAAKERWLALPNGTAIAREGDGDFVFPTGSVLMKHFRLNDALIETRLFMRHPDGGWAGYTYRWNSQRTDATLVQGGTTATIGQQTWIYPSEDDCLRCHTSAAGFTLGLEAAQLNTEFFYESTGRVANQLRTLDHITLFNTPLGDPALQPAMPDPFDASAPLDRRARAYLHTNCSQCHRPGGPTPTTMDLRYGTALSNTAACNATPQEGDLGMGSPARIIAPGNPNNSVLLARVSRRDASGMPPLASTLVDNAGVELLNDWIEGLTSCQ